MRKHKNLTLDLSGENEGEVTALFSRLNVIDLDGDVTVPGAFENGAPVRLSAYGHSSASHSAPVLPVGRGTIEAGNDIATFRGKFFINTTLGRDTWLTVKEMGDLQEWSYEFDILESEPGTYQGQQVTYLKKLKVHGVSPVYLGAGIGTQTLDIKSHAENGEEILARIADYIEHTKARAALRQKENRKGDIIGAISRNRLESLVSSLEKAKEETEKLLGEYKDDGTEASDIGAQLYAEFLALEARTNGVLVN